MLFPLLPVIPTILLSPLYLYPNSISLIISIPFALIFFVNSFSAMPGLLIIIPACKIFSSVCLSSNSISFNSNSLLYSSLILPESETSTSYFFCLASKAAPTPLSPAPSMISFLFIHFLRLRKKMALQ